MRTGASVGRAVALCAAMLLTAGAVRADPDSSGANGDDKAAQELRLHGLEDAMRASDEQRRHIEADIETFRADRARLSAALIDTTAKVQDAEREIAAANDRLASLNANADALSRSLENRRGVIADVLAVLQRMGSNPPPAILVRPRDMAEAIRAATLLGSTVDALKTETEALRKERDEVTQRSANLALDKTRLTALIDARQQSLSAAEQTLATQREHDAQLAGQAATLKDLIIHTEAEIGAAKSADQAIAADIAAKAAAARGADPARLKPAVAFADARGSISLPAAGAILRAFGVADPYGGSEKGVSIATPAGATVSSPVDGSVTFSGPYRSYGQLLIINAGGGYTMVLAGMDRINVSAGQFVLAGEPVAIMGDGTARTATAAAIGATQPVLYIELRKDGSAIDPGPWWAKSDIEKARG
jgi:septal ring factor EnvC (AmiA/AmiB activator)